MNSSILPDVYIKDGNVCCGTRILPIKEQRGKKYVHYKGRQLNVKAIPVLLPEPDPVFDYIFGGGFQSYPCPAMDYWILRYRLKRNISIKDFMQKYL